MISTCIIGKSSKMGFDTADFVSYRDVCFAPCFHTEWSGDKNFNYSWSAFRLSKDEITVEQADWFLREVVGPAIPDRMKSFIKTEHYDKEVAKSFTAKAAELKNRFGWHFADDDGTPWVISWIDMDNVFPEDAYILWATLRCPQETPQIVVEAHKIWEEHGCTPEEAYMCACFRYPRSYGHQLITAYSLGDKWKKNLNKFTLTKKWLSTKLSDNTWRHTNGKLPVDSAWAQLNSLYHATLREVEDILKALQQKD